MKKSLLIALVVGIPLVACTQESTDKSSTPAKPAATDTPPAEEPPAEEPPAEEPPAPVIKTADDCLEGQDMDAADVDVKSCPAIPILPDTAPMGKEKINLGAWEMGTTSKGD